MATQSNTSKRPERGCLRFAAINFDDCTPVEELQPFERGRIVGLREAGWTNRQLAAHCIGGVSLL